MGCNLVLSLIFRGLGHVKVCFIEVVQNAGFFCSIFVFINSKLLSAQILVKFIITMLQIILQASNRIIFIALL